MRTSESQLLTQNEAASEFYRDMYRDFRFRYSSFVPKLDEVYTDLLPLIGVMDLLRQTFSVEISPFFHLFHQAAVNAGQNLAFTAIWKVVMGPEEPLQHQLCLHQVVENCTEAIREAITHLYK